MTSDDGQTERRKDRPDLTGAADQPAAFALFDGKRRAVALSSGAKAVFSGLGVPVEFDGGYDDIAVHLFDLEGETPYSDSNGHVHAANGTTTLCLRSVEMAGNQCLVSAAPAGTPFACATDSPAPNQTSDRTDEDDRFRHYRIGRSGWAASPWIRGLHPEDRQKALAEIARCEKNPPGAKFFEFRKNSKRGRIACRSRCWPLYDRGGRITHLICRDVDSTDGAAVPTDDFYRDLVERLPDAIVVTHDGSIVFANEAAIEFLAASDAAQLTGRLFFDLVAIEDRALLTQTIEPRTTTRDADRAIEIGFETLSGVTVHGEILSREILWGGVPARMMVIHDLGGRRSAEAALRESESRFAALADNIPGAVFQRKEDPWGHITYPYISSGVWETHGLKADDVMRDPNRLLKSIHEENYSVFRHALRVSRDNLTPCDTELRTVRADGEEVWIRSIAKPRRLQDGSTVWDGVLVDITPQKRAEASLRKNETFLRVIADSLPARIAYVDAAERFAFANKEALNWYRRPAENVIGRTVADVLGELPSPTRSRIDRALRGQSISYQSWVDHPIFGRRFIRMHYLSDIGPDGKVRGFVHIAVDITDEKRAHAVLLEAKELAEKANADKSSFLRAAGHDLRQPTQAISLLCYALSEYVTAPAGRAILDDLDRAVRAMHSVLSGVLGYSQLEDGNVEPFTTDFPLSEVFDQMRSEFELQAKQKNIDMRIVASRQFVRSDVALLNRLVQNLVSNAIKYTGSGRIVLGARRQGNRIRIEVWDTGRGIPSNELDKIFREFYQVQPAGEPHTSGLGLGLAIVEKIARLLGHEIIVDSNVGSGTMFAVVVDAAERPADISAR